MVIATYFSIFIFFVCADTGKWNDFGNPTIFLYLKYTDTGVWKYKIMKVLFYDLGIMGPDSCIVIYRTMEPPNAKHCKNKTFIILYFHTPVYVFIDVELSYFDMLCALKKYTGMCQKVIFTQGVGYRSIAPKRRFKYIRKSNGLRTVP